MGRIPFATWNPIRNCPGISYVPGAPKRGVLHSTEGPYDYVPRGDGSYLGVWTPPQVTVARNGVFQHIDTSLGGYAMVNLMGGVETNRQGAIQIEVCGRAADAPTWPAETYVNLAMTMRWLEHEHGIRSVPVDDFHYYPPEEGNRLGHEPWRMSFPAWNVFDGWCGHQHVPENSHGDPGKIRLDLLFPKDKPPPNGNGFPIADYSEASVKTARINSGTPTGPFSMSDPQVARWRSPFPGRPPTPIAATPNTLIQLRSPIGVHVEDEDLVLDISFIDEGGNPVGPFDIWVTVA